MYASVDFTSTGTSRDITKACSATNPWAARSSGGSARLLELAGRSGYVVSTEETVVRCQELRESSPSVCYFRLLREIASLDAQLASVNLQLQMCALDKDTCDLTSIKLLEKRVGNLMQFSTHLSDTLRGKDVIVQRLKQPYSGDCLQVEPSAQRHVVQQFKLASSLLTDLNYHLENVEWNQKNLRSVASHVEKALWRLTAASDQLEATVATVQDFREAVSQLHGSRLGTR